MLDNRKDNETYNSQNLYGLCCEVHGSLLLPLLLHSSGHCTIIGQWRDWTITHITHGRQSRFVSEPLNQVCDRIRHNVRVFFVTTGALPSDVGKDSRDLLCFFGIASFEVDCWSQAQTASNAMWDRVCGSDGVANTVTEADTSSVQKWEERRVTC